MPAICTDTVIYMRDVCRAKGLSAEGDGTALFARIKDDAEQFSSFCDNEEAVNEGSQEMRARFRQFKRAKLANEFVVLSTKLSQSDCRTLNLSYVDSSVKMGKALQHTYVMLTSRIETSSPTPADEILCTHDAKQCILKRLGTLEDNEQTKDALSALSVLFGGCSQPSFGVSDYSSFLSHALLFELEDEEDEDEEDEDEGDEGEARERRDAAAAVSSSSGTPSGPAATKRVKQ